MIVLCVCVGGGGGGGGGGGRGKGEGVGASLIRKNASIKKTYSKGFVPQGPKQGVTKHVSL